MRNTNNKLISVLTVVAVLGFGVYKLDRNSYMNAHPKEFFFLCLKRFRLQIFP